MATTSIRNWNFEQFHVEQDIAGGEFLNAATILIAAGPPQLRNLGAGANLILDAVQGLGTSQGVGGISDLIAGATNAAQAADDTLGNITNDIDDLSPVAYPIGVVEAVNMSQARQIQRLFEIGSKRSYFIPGRNIAQVAITRTLFNGPSLMRALYAYYPPESINSTVRKLLSEPSKDLRRIKNQPGFGDFFINLDSDLFDVPTGILMFAKSTDGDPYGAVYLENCYLNTHQISISATSTLLAEGVTIQFDQALPIDVGGKVGITDFVSGGADIITSAFG
jgi:hypothetical protein